MSASWCDDDEELKVGGAKRAMKAKPRFSFAEVKMLLEAVKRNRYIILQKFNQGVSAETKKQTWAEITDQVNGLGENHREVRQIMKKWADLKCDGKRRIAALRGPNGNVLGKKNLGPVETMVHKILMMSPRGDADSDADLADDDDFSKSYTKSLPSNSAPYSYLSLTESSHSLPGGGGASLDMSPLSSPEKDLGDPFHSSSEFDMDLGDDGDRTLDLDDNDDSLFSSCPPPPAPPSSSASMDPLSDDVLPRVKPVHTYSRNGNGNQNHTASSQPTSESDANATAASSQSPPASSVPPPTAASSSSSDSTSQPPPASSSPTPPLPASSTPCDPLPAGASSCRSRDHVAQMASQSLQQQRAGRMLLTSVSHSLEMLAQSVQLLVESQQEFVQESLLLQRETVDVLRDFSNTALSMLHDKTHHH